jgi:hypothetical protein
MVAVATRSDTWTSRASLSRSTQNSQENMVFAINNTCNTTCKLQTLLLLGKRTDQKGVFSAPESR